MAHEATQTPAFPGFPDFRANVTFVPIQFFTVVVPHSSRGCARVVGYAIRKVLGWVDEHGNPTREQLQFSYRELIEKAGVSRESIADALREAAERHFLRCVQSPRPDRKGEAAQSGIYELCWDQEGRYTDIPDEFRGFYYPEAAVIEVQEAAGVVARPKAARKNIPNAFFDYLLPRERLSVIRVVGALLFYSIQWGPGGERKLPVRRSITELSRLTKLSRQHVHEAVILAQKRGYIQQADAGYFDPAAGKDSRAGTYGIRWVTCREDRAERTEGAAKQPVTKGERELEQSEKVDGAPIRKGERHQSEMVNGERSKRVNGISVKKELKKVQTAASGVSVEEAVDLVRGASFRMLMEAGFDERAAGVLAKEFSPAAISRQIEWLPLRKPCRNRMGMLRRAIEQSWPPPQAAREQGNEKARLFASHYYAEYHGYLGPATTEPFPKDVAMAERLISRLPQSTQKETSLPELGRRFARMVRAEQTHEKHPKPNLSFALVLYADKFLRSLASEISTEQRTASDHLRQKHKAHVFGNYMNYVRQRETELRAVNSPMYSKFMQRRERVRDLLVSGPFAARACT